MTSQWSGFVSSRDRSLDSVEIRCKAHQITQILHMPHHISQVIAQYGSNISLTHIQYKEYIEQFIEFAKVNTYYDCMVHGHNEKQRLKVSFVNKTRHNSHIILRSETELMQDSHHLVVLINDFPDVFIHIEVQSQNVHWMLRIYRFFTKFHNFIDKKASYPGPAIFFSEIPFDLEF